MSKNKQLMVVTGMIMQLSIGSIYACKIGFGYDVPVYAVKKWFPD